MGLGWGSLHWGCIAQEGTHSWVPISTLTEHWERPPWILWPTCFLVSF